MAAYIALSSGAAAHLARSVVELGQIEQWKGLAFVVFTTGLVFVTAGTSLQRDQRSAELLARQRELLVTAERQALAGTMAGAIANDVNNALTVLLGEVDGMEVHDEMDRRSIDLVLQSSERILELNRRLVSAVRHSTATDAQQLELVEAIRGSVDVLRAHHSLRQCRVEVEGEPVPVVTSAGLLAQIASNLLINAGEATDGRGHVVVRVAKVDGRARIEVDDDGPGVPPDRRPDLFSALRTTKPSGSGLGLYSVRARASALGGEVEVGESPLGGARFTVTLAPRAQGGDGGSGFTS
ncbi:MAG: HAMP domain-containing sensor histidine kinase [Myxococcota bacterium]